MIRLHLFEWEDQPWLPSIFRNFITDHLHFSQNLPFWYPIDLAIAQCLKDLLRLSNTRRIIDLCSGAGGPLEVISHILLDKIAFPVEILLTDLFPNISAFKRIEKKTGGRIKGNFKATSAFDVPRDLNGIRTFFSAFHHFKPEEARLVLLDALRKGASVAVFELGNRTLLFLLLNLIRCFFRAFFLTPMVENFTFVRFILTYVVPLAPAILMWDACVSVLRMYTPDELLNIAMSIESEGYVWKSGKLTVSGPLGLPVSITYLTGYPQ